ncbi:MAG: zinc ribbon domain-containing protein [Bacilli bacterium]|nr:zinc ribbon domain-containing protein [Bacilli bacterium]
MRRDLFHYYKGDVKTVFDAYYKILRQEPFRKEPTIIPNKLITFGIGFSFKFNMNGGAVHIHFAKRGEGTAVQVRFTIAQLFGARYKAYDKLMCDHVEKVLGYRGEPMNVLGDEYFDAQPEPEPEPKSTPSLPQGGAAFCPKCGQKLNPGDKYCPSCGNKLE